MLASAKARQQLLLQNQLYSWVVRLLLGPGGRAHCRTTSRFIDRSAEDTADFQFLGVGSGIGNRHVDKFR